MTLFYPTICSGIVALTQLQKAIKKKLEKKDKLKITEIRKEFGGIESITEKRNPNYLRIVNSIAPVIPKNRRAL